MSNLSPRALKIDAAAEYIAVSRSEVYRLKDSDPDFPRPFSYDANGLPRYDRLDLDAWIEKKKQAQADRDLSPEARKRVEEISTEARRKRMLRGA